MKKETCIEVRSGGFTLVELLLAITLLSMLMALAYGGLRASTRATDRGQVILEESSRIRMAHQFVRKQFNQILPMAFDESDDGKERVMFEGSADHIRFVGPMPGYLSFGGPQVQELTFIDTDRGQALVLSHALLQDFEESALYERDPIVLIDRIENGSFQFLAKDESGEMTDWAATWDEPQTLPLSISLDVEFEEDVYLAWPLLTASVRIDESAIAGIDDLGDSARSQNPAIRELLTRKGNEE